MAKKALGKGLGALIKPVPSQPSVGVTSGDGESVHYLPIAEVVPSPRNPRKMFTEEEISQLGDSIREHGIIQPLIVRQVYGKYELIAGERRWRASQAINLKTVPAIVREASDQDVIEMALIENLQRQDLNPIEEAAGYLRLAQEFDLRQEDIAKRVGKSRASVANAIRLLDLPDELQAFLAKGQITVGHAKAILALKDEEHKKAVADQVIRQKMTVRQTEKAVQDINTPAATAQTSSQPKAGLSPELVEVQNSLRDHFSTYVSIADNGKKGKIELEYYGADDLQRILDLLGLGES